jgi:hypothetical protein
MLRQPHEPAPELRGERDIERDRLTRADPSARRIDPEVHDMGLGLPQIDGPTRRPASTGEEREGDPGHEEAARRDSLGHS